MIYMAGIVGTVVTVESFLSNRTVNLTVKPNEPQQQTICLAANRKYIIPAFQRELRWDNNTLKMLLSDLSHGPKFLGNIILTIKAGDKCEIIDGQQRTTVLMLIVTCIRSKFGAQIFTPSLCPIVNESFMDFSVLLDAEFNKNTIPQQRWDAAICTDDYKQFERIEEIWSAISSSELLSDRHKAQDLLNNICKSEFNVIASYSDSLNISIQYFLDVNLKGVRLDNEDIFKGYLFSQDDREETRDLWKKNKCDALRLNDVSLSSQEKRYPLMKLYEHFFYCDLYLPNGNEYSSIKFGENFCLTTEFNCGNTIFYEGSHLIEAIKDQRYLQNALYRLNICIMTMIDIIENEGPSASFKGKFICAEKIDSYDIKNCHYMLKKILLEKEIIPKVLALKYILTYLDGSTHTKAEYKSIYSVFCASVLFTIFANKKESDTFYSFVKEENWISLINEWLYDYTATHTLTRGKVLAAYRCSEEESDVIQQIRCKSLAAIYNYFRVIKSGEAFSLSVSNIADLYSFFNNSDTYSLEHLIIGEKGTLSIKTKKFDFRYDYPSIIKRYRNSLFNYIFIPKTLNSALSNNLLYEKTAKIGECIGELSCAYSKNYFETLSEDPNAYFVSYPTEEEIDKLESESEVVGLLDEYFTKNFPNDFLLFSMAIVNKLKWDH